MRITWIVAIAAVVAWGCANTAAPPTSADEWSRHDLGLDGPRIHAIVEGGPGYIGVGSDLRGQAGGSGVWGSRDGVTWTMLDEVRTDRALIDLVAGGPGFVAISATPASFWTSSDGTAWSQSPAAAGLENEILLAVARGGDRLVAVGRVGFWTSPDGLAWTNVPVPGVSGTINDVVAGGPGFVAVGSVPIGSMETKGGIWTSSDGDRWTRIDDRPAFARADIRSVATDGSGIVAVGYTLEPTGQFRPAVWRSDDGLSWNASTVNDETIPVPADGALEGALMSHVASSGSRWLAAGVSADVRSDGIASDIALWSSADGSTWERLPHRAIFEAGMSESSIGEFGPGPILMTDERTIIAGASQGPQTSIWMSPPAPDGVDPAPRPSAGPPGAVGSDQIQATPAPNAP